jgi:ABC-type uncharacterized transport system permease subunit
MAATLPLTAPHGASLATTAGITSSITLVATVAFAGQLTGLGDTARWLADIALSVWVAGSGLLWLARNAVGTALDLAGSDPVAARHAGRRGLVLFQLGVAADLTGIACTLAAKVALVHGETAWLGVDVAGAFAVAACVQAVRVVRAK